MLVLKYPLSWSVARRLKEGDEVRYSGKLVFLSYKALIRMEEYMRYEGRYPYDISGELVYIKESSPIFIESIYKLGASAIVKESELKISNDAKKLIRKFERPLFETEKVEGDEAVKLYPDLEDGALREIWVSSLPMKVIVAKRRGDS